MATAQRSQKVGYLFITPAVLHLEVFAILPIGYALRGAPTTLTRR